MVGAGGGVPRVGSAAAGPTTPLPPPPLAGCGNTLGHQQPWDFLPPKWSSLHLLLAALPGGGRLQFWGCGRGQGPMLRSPEQELPGHAVQPASPRLALLASALQAAPVPPSRAVSAPAVRPEPEHLGTDFGRGRWRRQSQGWGRVQFGGRR